MTLEIGQSESEPVVPLKAQGAMDALRNHVCIRLTEGPLRVRHDRLSHDQLTISICLIGSIYAGKAI